MARALTGRQNIVTMQGKVSIMIYPDIPLLKESLLGAYHGRTFGAMAVTKSKTVYSDSVAPLMARSLIFHAADMLILHLAWGFLDSVSVLAPASSSTIHSTFNLDGTMSIPTSPSSLTADFTEGYSGNHH